MRISRLDEDYHSVVGTVENLPGCYHPYIRTCSHLVPRFGRLGQSFKLMLKPCQLSSLRFAIAVMHSGLRPAELGDKRRREFEQCGSRCRLEGRYRSESGKSSRHYEETSRVHT